MNIYRTNTANKYLSTIKALAIMLLLLCTTHYTSTALFAQNTGAQIEEEEVNNASSSQSDETGVDNATSAEEAPSTSEEEEYIESELGTVIFSAKGDIYSFSEIVDNSLYKGLSLFFDAKADTRYAVFSSSSSVDTLIRLSINNMSVYRDLYLGEDAGIVFTPQKDEQVVITVFATGRLDGSLQAKDMLAYRAQQGEPIGNSRSGASSTSQRIEPAVPTNQADRTDNTNANANGTSRSIPATNVPSISTSRETRELPIADTELLANQKLGEYFVEIVNLSLNLEQDTVTDNIQGNPLDIQTANDAIETPLLATLPFFAEAKLSPAYKIVHRIAREYSIALTEGERVYLRMTSQEFDTLLEVSDRYGRTIISDDWAEGTSLITFEVPSTDEYFVTASSFDGLRRGQYQIEVQSTQNTLIEEVKGQITPSSAKILQKYASEYSLEIQQGEYLTAIVQSLDTNIEVALVNENLNAIHFETINTGETAIIPLYVPEKGKYKLLMLSNLRLISNYLLSIYK